jgi:hypothetical protein
MSAARCAHGRPVAVDGAGCDRCGGVAQLDDERDTTTPARRLDARAERDRGLADALDRPAADWDRAVVDQAIRYMAETGRKFSAADLRPLLPAVSPAVIGAAFMAAARAGTIERVGDAHARHAEGHARRVGLWRGTPSPPLLPLPAPRHEPVDKPKRTEPETIAAKAARLLVAGRVRVRLADEHSRVVADVEGDHGTYTVRRTAEGRWSCPCPAGRHGHDCGHVAAVRLVVTP